MPLTMAEQGSKVRLVSVDAGRDLQSRLSAMGLVPGAEIEVLGDSSRGPFLIAVKGSRLMVGRGMAHRIMVA